MTAPKYKRILLKLSGEALMGNDAYGINPQTIAGICGEIKAVADMGVAISFVAWPVRLPGWIEPLRITWACSPRS